MIAEKGSIAKLGKILNHEQPRKVFVICGDRSFNLAKVTVDEVLGENYPQFIVKQSDVTIKMVNEAVDKLILEKCDMVIGIGGGTIMDLAKMTSLFASNDNSIDDYIFKNKKVHNRKINLILVPTTSGSGSEATQFAVVYNDLKKYSILHKSMLPDHVILDPELTFSLPPYQTAVSGMDAFCQGIESFWSVNSNAESRKLSLESIDLVLANLVNAVTSPSEDSRYQMCKAANLAGQAINITKTTAPHALSYTINKVFGIPHGHAVSLTMPYIFQLHLECDKDNLNDSRGISFFRKIMTTLSNKLKLTSSQTPISFFRNYMELIGLKTTIVNKEYSKEIIDLLIENINMERMNNNPVLIDRNNAKIIFNKVLV
ncbi:MAG: hypothetical protein CL678_14810 [Bdellovibrionaceae bacterium]|nr:hypothetical protein [Pseudobdellovibrionaceae bacterium]|tara:strand:+ start:1991 stop:3106 length:1116 start_codon:yes stop_codon:yes gene_type:complete